MNARRLQLLTDGLSAAPLGVGIGFAIGTGSLGAIIAFSVYLALRFVSLAAAAKHGKRLDAELKKFLVKWDASNAGRA